MYSIAAGYANSFGGYSYRRNANNPNQKLKKPPKKYMFLCEVSLGTPKTLFGQDPNASDGLPNSKYQSVWAQGRTGPDQSQSIFLENGTKVPLGPIVAQPNPTQNGVYRSYNNSQYVVYDASQVKIRYLLELRDVGHEYYSSFLFDDQS